MFISSDKYQQKKREYRKMGVSTKDIIPVDLNAGFVPHNTSQAAKGGMHNVRMADKVNRKRFGL